MDIQLQLTKSIHILRNGGLLAFLRKFKRFLRVNAGPYRPNEAMIAFEVLRANTFSGLMIDVGAHFGGMLRPFAETGWQVFAFEPDSENRKQLESSFGNMQNVIIDKRAVSDHSQEKVILYKSKNSTGISGLSAFHPSHEAGEAVDVITLESLFDEYSITNQDVDFLKIDTEGFDLQVLKGIPWHRISPRLILCEFEDSKTIPFGYTFTDLANFLEKHDYKLIISEWYPIKEYGTSHDWKQFNVYPCHLGDSRAWGNILATKEDDLYTDLLRFCKLV